MARIRSVKPEFWDDRKLAKRTSRDARLLYIGLWNLADEHARLNGDPAWIKGQIFAFDDDLGPADVDALLKELESVGGVVRYEVDDDPYLLLPKLPRHQRLEPDKVQSRIPAPPRMLQEPREAVRADLSESGADESARRPNESAPDADKSAPSYVAGSMEHVAGSMEQGDARGAPPSIAADGILEEHLAALPRMPGKEAVRETGTAIDRLLAENVPEADVKEALARWRAKGKYRATILHNLVADIQAERALPAGGRGSRASPRSAAPPKQVNYTDEEYTRGW